MKNRIRIALAAGFMSCALFANSAGSLVYAADIAEIPAEEIDSVYAMEVQSNNWGDWVEGPQIYSESGIVMDVDTGTILYAKNIDDKHYPASITKIMTALVALRTYEMDEIVTFTWDDIGFLEYGDAHIGIKPDEKVMMEDCMYAMLFASANEVSHAVGAHYEGGYEAFLEEMNRLSEELGCTNSHWMNTHGLHDPEHYTSVHDMAIIGSELFKIDKFREIESYQSHEIPETEMTDEKRYAWQNHKMVYSGNRHYYEYFAGGKTGYTNQALTTLVTFATKDDMNLVAVVMRTHGGGNNAYLDTKNMLNYAFDNFEKQSLAIHEIGNGELSTIEESVRTELTLPVGALDSSLVGSIIDPTELGDRTADLTLSYGGRELYSMEATITDEHYNELHAEEIKAAEEAARKEARAEAFAEAMKVVGIVIAIGVLAFAGLLAAALYRRKQKRKMRSMKRRKYMRELEERSRWDER